MDYLKAIYSRMHRGIIAHPELIDRYNTHLLDGITFAFICIDATEEKQPIIERLEALGTSFVDVGMGLELVDGSLGGILRITASTSEKREHVWQGRIAFAGDKEGRYLFVQHSGCRSERTQRGNGRCQMEEDSRLLSRS